MAVDSNSKFFFIILSLTWIQYSLQKDVIDLSKFSSKDSGQCPDKFVRLDMKSPFCYRIGSRGPCKEHEIFYAMDSIFGYCDCIQSPGVVSLANRCYLLNTQGPCAINQWLEWSGEHQRGLCRMAKCPADGKHILWTNGKCYHLESRGPCEEGLKIRRTYDSPGGTCTDGSLIRGIISIVGNLQKNCAPGSKMNSLGQCRKIFTVGRK